MVIMIIKTINENKNSTCSNIYQCNSNVQQCLCSIIDSTLLKVLIYVNFLFPIIHVNVFRRS